MSGTHVSLVVAAHFPGSARALACWRWRPRHRELVRVLEFCSGSYAQDVSARAPLRLRSGQAPPAREARALPYPRYPCNPWFLMLCSCPFVVTSHT